MQDPIRELFEGYEPKTGCHAMTEEEAAVWEKAQAILGESFVDELVYSQCHSLTEEQYDYFREGFRLGARLMLELK